MVIEPLVASWASPSASAATGASCPSAIEAATPPTRATRPMVLPSPANRACLAFPLMRPPSSGPSWSRALPGRRLPLPAGPRLVSPRARGWMKRVRHGTCSCFSRVLSKSCSSFIFCIVAAGDGCFLALGAPRGQRPKCGSHHLHNRARNGGDAFWTGFGHGPTHTEAGASKSVVRRK